MHEGRQSNAKNSWLGQPQEMMCCGQMFVLKFSTTLTVHKSSSALQYGRNRGQRRAGTAPRNSPEEKSSRSTPLEKPAARCPCSASWAQPVPPSAATHPQPLCQPHLLPPCTIREAQPGFQSDGSALGFGPLSYRDQNTFSTSFPLLQD